MRLAINVNCIVSLHRGHTASKPFCKFYMQIIFYDVRAPLSFMPSIGFCHPHHEPLHVECKVCCLHGNSLHADYI